MCIFNDVTGGAIYGNNGLKNAVNGGSISQAVGVTRGVHGGSLLTPVEEIEPDGNQRAHILLQIRPRRGKSQRVHRACLANEGAI